MVPTLTHFVLNRRCDQVEERKMTPATTHHQNQHQHQHQSSTQNNKKKLKIDESFIDELWGHYRDFLDSTVVEEEEETAGGPGPDDICGDNNGSVGGGHGGDADYDSLHEILSLTKDVIPIPQLLSTEDNKAIKDSDDGLPAEHLSKTIKSRVDLLPILLSVVYYHLADVAITDYLSLLPEMEHHQRKSDATRIQLHIQNSLAYFPSNAASWSIGANFGRITRTLSPVHVRMWYEQAVMKATNVRHQALILLEEEEDDEVERSDEVEEDIVGKPQNDGEVKEWVELLLLNQVCGVEYEELDSTELDTKDEERKKRRDGSRAPCDKFENEYDDHRKMEKKNSSSTIDDDDDDDDDDEDGKPKESPFENEYSQSKDGDEDDDDDADDDKDEGSMTGQYSSSSVESMSRFMSAMLLSVEGNHEEALKHLKKFPLTHRIHPNVWSNLIEEPSTKSAPKSPPVVFRPSDGVLPPHLYSAMTKLFAPKAPYWTESNYSNRGYYSFFMDFNPDQERPPNLIEDIIVNHLLPRAQQALDLSSGSQEDEESQRDQICGFEWWAHTRPVAANLGHNLHFDTDESMLEQQGKVTHPVLSSVLYLTGGSANAGATIVFDETPDSKEVASKCWKGVPKDNSFLIFPGECLHGVLPCPGDGSNGTSTTDDDHNNTKELVYDFWKTDDTEKDDEDEQPHRLTFMVGFWTRNVPATMKKRELYGPCGPLPPRGTKWVDEMSDGYDDNLVNDGSAMQKNQVGAPAVDMVALPLPSISPAWEQIDSEVKTRKDHDGEGDIEDSYDLPLKIPPSIDHRFFVQNAPACFRESLFE